MRMRLHVKFQNKSSLLVKLAHSTKHWHLVHNTCQMRGFLLWTQRRPLVVSVIELSCGIREAKRALLHEYAMSLRGVMSLYLDFAQLAFLAALPRVPHLPSLRELHITNQIRERVSIYQNAPAWDASTFAATSAFLDKHAPQLTKVSLRITRTGMLDKFCHDELYTEMLKRLAPSLTHITYLERHECDVFLALSQECVDLMTNITSIVFPTCPRDLRLCDMRAVVARAQSLFIPILCDFPDNALTLSSVRRLALNNVVNTSQCKFVCPSLSELVIFAESVDLGKDMIAWIQSLPTKLNLLVLMVDSQESAKTHDLALFSGHTRKLTIEECCQKRAIPRFALWENRFAAL